MRAIFTVCFLCLLVAPAIAADFHGYHCTQDCSGHKAGYAWAEKKGITERENCGGKSNSFIEGCYAWVEGQAAGNEETDHLEEAPADQEDTGAAAE